MTKKPKRANLRPPGKCIFCGGGPMSEEHIWSEWTWPHFEVPKTDSHSRGIYELPIKDLSTPIRSEVFRRQGDILNFRLKVVCRRCNNKWMSRIDERTKSLLAPMMKGAEIELDKNRQLLLATWFALKCMVLEFRDEKKLVSTPQEDRDFLFKNQCPSLRGWDIRVGKAIGPIWNKFCYRSSATIASVPFFAKVDRSDVDAPKNTQTLCLGVGSVFFYGCQSSHGTFKVPSALHQRLVQIWPLGPNVNWPPNIDFTDREGFLASTILARFAKNLVEWEDANL